MYYTTKFVWDNKQLYIYYNYKSLGYIPTGIEFTHRNKTYSTIQVMNALAKLHKAPTHQKFDHKYWYIKGNFNKKGFIEMQKKLV